MISAEKGVVRRKEIKKNNFFLNKRTKNERRIS